MTAHQWMFGVALVVTALAAWTDSRTGEIPNWVTLVPLALAPLVHAGIAYRSEPSAAALLAGAGASILGALCCLVIPVALYRAGAIGGGDTKLFAAVGAIGRTEFGVHAQTYAFVLGMLYAVALMVQRGKLGTTLGNVAALFRSFTRTSASPAPGPSDMTEVRFGPAIFAGTVLTTCLQWSIR
jgi:prepilin peptidase CpaA